MVIVTHEMQFARQAGNCIVFMDGGEILEEGAPDDILRTPTHPRTQSFLSRFLGA